MNFEYIPIKISKWLLYINWVNGYYRYYNGSLFQKSENGFDYIYNQRKIILVSLNTNKMNKTIYIATYRA
jgi:hypothetical protein